MVNSVSTVVSNAPTRSCISTSESWNIMDRSDSSVSVTSSSTSPGASVPSHRRLQFSARVGLSHSTLCNLRRRAILTLVCLHLDHDVEPLLFPSKGSARH